MEIRKYLVHETYGSQKIVLTSKSNRISKELYNQLKSIISLEVNFFKTDKILKEYHPEIVIHFVNSNVPHKILENILNYCGSQNSQLIVVYPITNKPKNYLEQTIISNHKKNFSLKLKTITVDFSSDIRGQAARIISIFIYNYLPAPIIASLQINPKKNISKLYKYIAFLVLLILLPYFLVLIQLMSLSYFTNCSLQAFNNLDIEKTNKCARNSSRISKILYPQVNFLPGFKEVFNYYGLPISEFFQVLNAFSESTILLNKTTASLNAIVSNSLSQSTQINNLYFTKDQLTNLLGSTSESLAFLQSSLKDLYLSTSKPSPQLLMLGYKITTLRSFISKLTDLAFDFSKLIPNRKINYVFVLQDNTEIRPTGGYIDSLYIATLDSGKISQIQTFTSSQADSQLTGQVNPPVSFQAAVGVSNWLLRDANWDPDFPTSAKKIAWFIEKELKINIDGVVGINTGIFPEILNIVGPVELSKYKTKINSKNFYEEYLKHYSNDTSYEPSYLSTIVQEILKKYPELSSKQVNSILGLIANQLENKQLLISPITFSSPILDTAGWSGSLKTSQCISNYDCVSDYFYPVDSNIGFNKTDLNLVRQSKLDIQLTPTEIITSAKLSYSNFASQAGHTEIYKNYFRLYIPLQSQVDSVSLNGHLLPYSAYTLSSEHAMQLLSFPFVTSSGATSDLVVVYRQSLAIPSKFRYQLDLPKQPGRLKNPYQITLVYPPNWTLSAYITAQSPISPVATAGQLRYNSDNEVISRLDLDIITSP